VADKADHAPNRQLTLEQQDMVDDLAMAIVTLGDTFVNEAFGTCHRSHASMYAVPNLIKAKGGHAVAGFLVEKEIRHLHDALHAPARPFVAILGGAKVFDKMKFITNILPKVDRILVGGAMAYTLLKARGVPVGRSRVERDQLTEVEQILDIAGDKILLPVDHIATDHFSSEAQEAGEPVTVNTMSIPTDLMGLDIGPKTIAEYGNIIASANTVLWNGPMGAFELPEYAAGTESLAYLIAKATDKGAVSIIGGGDSAAAIENMGLNARMTHVSTGGGASMQYLEGSPMPGLEVLEDPTQPCSPRSR
jgi:phosphoglycerate kinase